MPILVNVRDDEPAKQALRKALRQSIREVLDHFDYQNAYGILRDAVSAFLQEDWED